MVGIRSGEAGHAEARTSEPAALSAYRALERMIVTLRLLPGANVSEASLVALTGFGRTPVREALQRLAWEGFLAIRPRSGITIAPINPSDWVKVIDARRGVEIVLAKSAAALASQVDIDRFREASDAMANAAGECDVAAFLDADKAFDEAIALAADNIFAVRLVQPLQTHGRRFWYRYRGAGGLPEAAERHRDLIAAIVARNPLGAASEAEKLMNILRAHAVAIAAL